MESRADRRTSRALHTVTTHANASDRPTYFIGELRLNRLGRQAKPLLTGRPKQLRATRASPIYGLGMNFRLCRRPLQGHSTGVCSKESR